MIRALSLAWCCAALSACSTGGDGNDLFGNTTTPFSSVSGPTTGTDDTAGEASSTTDASTDATSNGDGDGDGEATTTTGDGDGDGTTGDGDGDGSTGDGDGDGTTGDGDGDGDGSTGDGDGDGTTGDGDGDGDGDGTTGDGDGDGTTGDGDGDGDGSTGDGDGDGDGDGSAAMCGNGVVEGAESCDDMNMSSNDGCSSTCAWETNCATDNARVPVNCFSNINGNFSGLFGDVDGPRCGETFEFQDKIFEFTAATDQSVTATYTSSPDQNDGAIFVMQGSCHTGLCLASSLDTGDRRTVTFDVQAGLTYYLALELPSFQPNFTFALSCM